MLLTTIIQPAKGYEHSADGASLGTYLQSHRVLLHLSPTRLFAPDRIRAVHCE